MQPCLNSQSPYPNRWRNMDGQVMTMNSTATQFSPEWLMNLLPRPFPRFRPPKINVQINSQELFGLWKAAEEG